MTSVADVIAQAMVIIDDIRLQEELNTNPALFFRKMSGYIGLAIPMLSRPPELYMYLKDSYEPPTYSDATWTSTEESLTQETVIETGITEYELCSIVQISENGTYSTAYNSATYDPETGNITFPIQEQAGIIYDINFYNDGSFDTLSPAQSRLMALAVSIVWNERFTNNWLNLQPKIKDNSFSTVNEANYMDKLTLRFIEVRQAFGDELRKYEQDNAYQNLVPNSLKYRSLR